MGNINISDQIYKQFKNTELKKYAIRINNINLNFQI